MATHGNLPDRTNTQSTGYDSDDERGDPSSSLGLLQERLQAWKHMTGYLEDYMKAVAKDQKTQAKDSEKILKTLSSPLKEGHHFDQSLGGIAGLFENLRANTQAMSNLRSETEKNISGTVLPILERLHKEIKHKRKELDSGAGKGSKAVDAARNNSQKSIEALGQYTATYDSTGGRVAAKDDPYVLQRGVWYRLNQQVMEENNNRGDLIQVQSNFQQFEAHVIQSVQQALGSFNQFMSGQNDREKAMYGDISATASHITPDFEWNGFLQRNGAVLVSPNAPPKTIDSMSFPNQNHRATKALIEGSLERKGKGLGGLGGYKSNYYAVTPAGFLHEYKDNDNLRSDPSPETSLYLPDCAIGAVDGQKFTIKGKDTSGGKLSQKLSLSTEYTFKAHTTSDALQWYQIIEAACNGQASSLGMAGEKAGLGGVGAGAGTAATGAAYGTGAGAGTHGLQEQQQTGVLPHQQQMGTAAPGIAAPAGHAMSTEGQTALPAQQSMQSGVAQPGYHAAPGQTELGDRKY